MSKFYAVRKGNQTGIFVTWDECKQAINGFSGAQFKKFSTKEEAEAFMNGHERFKHTNGHESFKHAKDLDYSQFDIVIHTDGGCRNHGNKKGEHVLTTDPAAWAMTIDDHKNNKHYRATNGSFGKTNNYMEIVAVANALYSANKLSISHEKILVVCDSKYALNASYNNFMAKHAQTNFKMTNGEVWQKINDLKPKFTNLTWAWIHGHTGEEGNDEVDSLLNETMDRLEAERKIRENAQK